MSDSNLLLAQYLRQRQALGETELILDENTREQLFAWIKSPSAGSPENPKSATLAKAEESQNPDAETRGSASGQAVFAAMTPQAQTLIQIGEEAAGCTKCGLAGSRTTVVFGEGNPAAQLVIVGEAPGAEEDLTGRPFVGRAGKLLDKLLLSIGFPRETVYICNVLKCRPPGNRNPLPDEVEACSSFLQRQLALIRPKAILAVGTFPAQSLMRTTEPIGRLRGTVQKYEGIPLVPTYHPAALLRNPSWIQPVWEDLQRLRQILDD